MKKKEVKSKETKSKYVPTTEFYSQIIDSLQDYSIFTLDNEWIINSWSAGSTKIFGYETEEVIGKHFDIIFTDADLKNKVPKREITTAIKEGRATDNRWHITKDKNLFFAYGLVFPLIGLDGEKLGYVKILQDLTDKKKSEESIKKYVKELEELHSHKDNVLAILSHDLRTPLAAIIGVADYLRSNYDTLEPAEVKEFLEMIYKSSKNELASLDYLLEWARIKYASDVFSPTKIKVIEYIDNVFKNLSETASLNAINLHHEIEENTSVFADGKMLISIIHNIVSNAIRHTKKGGKITISAKNMEDSVIIQIKDTGDGMSKEIQEKLFKPQLNKLSKAREENKGAGIGLLLVKGFLEKNGGKIWVESTEGMGSSFYFSLPLDKPLFKAGSSDGIMLD